jgi:hypothetical protein
VPGDKLATTGEAEGAETLPLYSVDAFVGLEFGIQPQADLSGVPYFASLWATSFSMAPA